MTTFHTRQRIVTGDFGPDAKFVEASDYSRLYQAIIDLTDVFGDQMLALHIGPNLTCSEANALASFFVTIGQPERAVEWIWGHIQDEDVEDLHAHITTEDMARIYVEENL